ncbi:MAG: response regulator [Thermoplasmata archaeon]|nr:response regulator [Thermoplasmata archaeon]
MRVLVVDDNTTFLMQMKKFLLLKGFEVDTSARGKEAVEKLQRKRYDVVLLDLKMPDISGLEVIKEVKKKGVKTNFIVVTGYGEVESAVEAMKLGAVDYIQKPFDGENIVKIIERAGKRKSLPSPEYHAFGMGKVVIASYEPKENIEKELDLIADEYIDLKKDHELSRIIDKIDADSTLIISGISFLLKMLGEGKVKREMRKLLQEIEKREANVVIICGMEEEKKLLDELCAEEDTGIEEMLEICKSPIRRKLLHLLRMHGTLGYSEIMKEIDVEYSSKLAFHLKKLCNLKLVEKTKDGYVLTPHGQHLANILDAFIMKKKRIIYFCKF